MDLKDLQNLIRFVSKLDLAELTYKTKEYELNIKKNNYSVCSCVSLNNKNFHKPLLSNSSINDSSSNNRITEKYQTINNQNKYLIIKSPMVGTFYKKSGPDQSVFVKEGDFVVPGQVLCIIEAMKLFNEIESEVSGKIIKILVDNATPVEYHQPLFLIDINS